MSQKCTIMVTDQRKGDTSGQVKQTESDAPEDPGSDGSSAFEEKVVRDLSVPTVKRGRTERKTERLPNCRKQRLKQC